MYFLGPSDGPNAWNFHGEATNFHGAMSNFHGEATNFRGAMSNFRGEATNFCGEATGGNQWPLHKWIDYRIPADIVKKEEMEFLKDANERQTRQFVAIIANRHGVSLVCGILIVLLRGEFGSVEASNNTDESEINLDVIFQ